MAYIYQVTNKVNGKKYIGRTTYKRLRQRESTHWWYANNRRYNHPFPNALIKYGRDSFDWTVLEECSKEDQGIREIYWIDKIKPEYNATLGGDGGSYGVPCSEEKKRILSKAVAKSVINIDTEEVFDSLQEAADFANVSVSMISMACSGKKKSAGGYRWRLLDK
jgi:group I intron endonuclease